MMNRPYSWKRGKEAKKYMYTDQAFNHDERQTYNFFHKTMFNSKYLPIEKSNNTPKEKNIQQQVVLFSVLFWIDRRKILL